MRSDTAVIAQLDRRQAFGLLRISFGLIWLLNTFLQANSTYVSRFLHTFRADWAAGQPQWLLAYGHWMAGIVQSLGPEHVAAATVVLDGLLAASLLTGIGLRFIAWVGIVYNLWLWSTVGGLGGPYTQGATDPGTAIIYALTFVFVLATRSWEGLGVQRGQWAANISDQAVAFGRILFGLLWAFDSYWKWQPYFLTHADVYLQQAQQGQPAWIVAYIGLFIAAIHLVGTLAFGIFAALAESVIAISLLVGRWLRWMLPFGALYSFGLWTTAEGWGGPYGPGFTGNKGDVLGTTIIYTLVFLFLWVAYQPREATEESGVKEDGGSRYRVI